MSNLDREIQFCSDDSTYPMRVRFALMRLNRSVKLFKPEFGISWFHENFCRDHANSKVMRRGESWTKTNYDSIYQSLLQIVGGSSEKIAANVFSDYFNYIDFEVRIDDERGEALKSPESYRFAVVKKSERPDVEGKIRRVAVIIGKDRDYLPEDGRLIGNQKMLHEELEREGFDVVYIKHDVWISMGLADDKAKVEFLRRELKLPPQ